MIVSRHETVVSSHDTVISNNTTMAEYIKREMPDMNGNGERKAYYQVRSYSNLSSDDFVKKLCYRRCLL